MTEEMKRRWEEVITSTNMTQPSRKTWNTIRKPSNDPTTSSPPCLVSANQFPHQLLAMAEVTCHPHQNVLYYPPSNRRRYINGIPSQGRRVHGNSGITKDTKAPGKDDVLVEQLKISVPKPICSCW